MTATAAAMAAPAGRVVTIATPTRKPIDRVPSPSHGQFIGVDPDESLTCLVLRQFSKTFHEVSYA
jgi:hypothetical protein